jgi:hypothetical protein
LADFGEIIESNQEGNSNCLYKEDEIREKSSIRRKVKRRMGEKVFFWVSSADRRFFDWARISAPGGQGVTDTRSS